MPKTYKFLDLFSGIGGIRLGMERTKRFKCVRSCEINKQACRTYEENFGEDPYGDVTKIESDALPNFDVICGGFPCQAFSHAGHRRGFSDTRGTLFFEIARLMRDRKPLAGLFENVPGLASHDGGRTLETILATIIELGYKPYLKTLNARDFGVPQNRDRVYIVAIQEGLGYFKFPNPPLVRCSIRDIIEKDPVDDRFYLSDKYMTGLERHRRMQEEKGRGFGYEIRKLSGIANAVVCGGMGKERNLIVDKRGPSEAAKDRNGRHVRKMTPREWARLQGFPDSFKIPNALNVAYKQFGNSVAVPVVSAIAAKLAITLDGNEPSPWE